MVTMPSPAPRRVTGVAPPAFVPVLIGILTLVAFALRVAGLHASLTGDELFAYDDVHGRSLASMVSYIGHNEESSPPLFFVLAWFSAHLGDATVTIRWPSIVLGSATVPLTYLLARRLAGARVGVIAAALVALNPLAIWQGAEARPYEALMFFAVLSTLVLLAALDAPRAWSWWWLGYAVAVAATALTHYTCVFVLVTQTAWALWTGRERRVQILAASLGAVALFSWWLPDFHSSWVGVYDLLAVPLVPGQIARTLVQALIGHPGFTSLADFPGTPATVAVGVAVLAAGAAVVVHRRRARPAGPWPRSSVALVVLLALATPAGILLYSPWHNLLLVHNLISSLPYALIALAWLVCAPGRGTLSTVVTAVLLLVLALGAARTQSSGAQRANFRAAFAFINARAQAGDAIIDGSIFPFATGYAHYIPAYLTHPYLITTPDAASARVAWARARAGGRVFLLVQASSVLNAYHPSPLAGADPACANARTLAEAQDGCVALRATRSYPGLQRVVVSMYSGR
jgi:hypothetical protein